MTREELVHLIHVNQRAITNGDTQTTFLDYLAKVYQRRLNTLRNALCENAWNKLIAEKPHVAAWFYNFSDVSSEQEMPYPGGLYYHLKSGNFYIVEGTLPIKLNNMWIENGVTVYVSRLTRNTYTRLTSDFMTSFCYVPNEDDF